MMQIQIRVIYELKLQNLTKKEAKIHRVRTNKQEIFMKSINAFFEGGEMIFNAFKKRILQNQLKIQNLKN